MNIYSDAGNAFVAEQVPVSTRRILDVGCGSGDTARLIKARLPGCRIEGITYNPGEATAAERWMDRIHVVDVEKVDVSSISGEFDCLLFSHILEHTRDPSGVLMSFVPHLGPQGVVIIAVPNVLEWRTRVRLLNGEWSYADYGILDRTHLRFFTYRSADVDLFDDRLSRCCQVVKKLGDGSVPLGPLRRFTIFRPVARWLDRIGVRTLPNLFAWQTVVIAKRRGSVG